MDSEDNFKDFMNTMKYRPKLSRFLPAGKLKRGLVIIGRTRAGKSTLF